MHSLPLLAAAISLPQYPVLAFLRFVSVSPAPDLPDLLDAARRRLASSPAFHDVLLPSVHLGQSPALYVFSVFSAPRAQAATAAMDTLHFDGLIAPAPTTCFPFQKIYQQPRHILSHFLSALRTRLIDNIVASTSGVQRCKDGFLIFHPQLTPATDWGSGWEYKALSRPLVFCHIQLLPTASAVLVRPTLLPTPYLPLHSCLPLLPRSPLLLLPYGTPAYFLTTYSGPTSALVRQFRDSLQGHGQPPLDSSFIIGWISVENRQGEDKGITFVYPTRLCLAYVPALNRSLLDYTPDLPGPLQPSPKLLSASTPQSECPPTTYPHRPSLLGSPNTELKAFRALTLSKSRNIRDIAAQVSSYVDQVAKDRERERERLKREREGGPSHSPSLLARTTPSASSNPQTSAPPPLAVHTPTPTPTIIPTQNFYPSPPQADTTSVVPIPGNTSPVLPPVPQPPATRPPPTSAAPAQPHPITSSSSSSSYDPFGFGMDIGMDFGMDMGINFGMDMDTNLGRNSSPTSADAGNTQTYNDHGSRGMSIGGGSGMDGFEDFTDDDFSFFDRPSTHAPAPPPLQHPPAPSAISHLASNPLLVTSPPLFGDVHLSGPGPPPHPTPHSQSTPASHGGPWSSNLLESFTPRSVEHMDSVVAHELLTCTPGPTPFNVVDGIPPTPNVHLDHDAQPHLSSDMTVDEARKIFGPIPFAKYHRVSDGKYTSTGKFGLPSPPPDEPEITPSTTRRKSSFPYPSLEKTAESILNANASWRPRYDAMTDPRVGVVRKLIGVKRRHTTQGARTGKDIRTSPWTSEHEEWNVHRSSPLSEFNDIISELSEDEMSHSDDEGVSEEEEETPATSRPSTPPPSYLPLGPTLLHTQFTHAHLLPLSKPLRPPGSSIISGGPGGPHGGLAATPLPIANVPTPVSPAAGLGLSAEKWRALEVVINVLAKEAVENVVWRNTWMATNAFGSDSSLGSRPLSGVGEGGGRKFTEVWVSDVKFVEKVLGNLEGVKAGLSVGDVFGLDPATDSSAPQATPQILTSPKITMGKGEAIVTLLPPALRFWGKLGLGPKSGEKDATVFVLFANDGGQHRPAEVASWLAEVCTTYEALRLGKLKLGTSTYCVRDGVVQSRFDPSFRKFFANFTTSISNATKPTVLFFVVPVTLMSLSSPAFRQILSTMQKALKSSPENGVLVHLIPEHAINHLEHDDPSNMNLLSSLCTAIYNRILSPITQPRAKLFQLNDASISSGSEFNKVFLQKPIFTLARPVYSKVTYTRTVHASLDVLDRWTLLHAAYKVSRCGKWVMAAVVDQRGESWDQAVWLVKNDQQEGDAEGSASSGVMMPGSNASHEETFAVRKVWEFVVGFARKANVEWRIVISKLGIMDESELAAWTAFLPVVMPMSGLGSVHVSLLCADPDSPWLFTKLNASHLLPQQQQSGGAKPPPSKHNIFSDASSTTYALFPTITLPIAIPPAQSDLGPSLPYVADPSSVSSSMGGDGDAESVAATSPAAPSIPTSTTPTTTTTVPTTPGPISPTSPCSSSSSGSGSLPHRVGLLPRSTTCLVRVPCLAPLTSISMLHIHVLSTYCYPASLVKKHPTTSSTNTSLLELKTLHADVTKNFYELSVLAQARWNMAAPEAGSNTGIIPGRSVAGGAGSGRSRAGVNPILPLHLAMVDIMGQVTDGVDGVEIDS